MARRGGGGTQYEEIIPGVGAPMVGGPGAPVREDAQAAAAQFREVAAFGQTLIANIDQMEEVAALNVVAQKTSEHGIAATDATEQWRNGLTGTNPKEDLADFNRRMDELDAKVLSGVTGKAQQVLKIKLAGQRPAFYEAANRAIGAAGKQATLTTGAGLADIATKTALQMPDAAARDALFGEQVARFYDAQVANGSISETESATFTKQAWDNFNFQIAQSQADTAPSLFLAGIKKGPNGEPSEWEKRLTPEALNQLGPAIKRAQGDNTLGVAADQFRDAKGNVNWQGVLRYAMDPKNKPADVPADQWEHVLHSAQVRVHMADAAQAKARSDNEYYTQVNVAKMVNKGDLSGAMDLVRKSNLPITQQQSILSSLATGARKVDDPGVYSAGLDSVTKGTWTDQWGLQQHNAGLLSYDGFERLRKLAKEADIPTVAAIKDGQSAINSTFAKSMMAQGTPEQAEAELAARRELAQAVEKARQEGKDVTELVTPGRPGYVLGEIIRRNSLTLQQQMDAMAGKMKDQQQAPADTRPARSAAATSEAMRGLGIAPAGTAPGPGNPISLNPAQGQRLRLPGETIQQYRARVGGL